MIRGMSSNGRLALMAAFFAPLLAFPLENQDKVKSFHVPIKRSFGRKKKAKTLEDQPGVYTTIDMKDYRTISYKGVVKIGDPPREFEVVFDTGSADLWVFSAHSRAKEMEYLHTYNSEASSSYDELNEGFEIMYALGNCSGVAFRETVKLGNIVVEKMKMGAATKFSKNFDNENDHSDGILGLAYKKAAAMKSSNIVQKMKSEGLIDTASFSFILGGDPSKQGYDGSRLMIGPPDYSLAIDNKITHVPILDGCQGMWCIDIDAVLINGVDHGLCTTGCTGVPDTGTSMIVVPLVLWPRFAMILTKDASCSIDSLGILCHDTPQGLPVFSFVLGNTIFNLEPKQYIVADGVLGFMPSKLNTWILGDTFLKNVYTVFHMDNYTVGFAHTNSTGYWSPSMNVSRFQLFLLYLSVAFVSVGLLTAMYTPCKQYFTRQVPSRNWNRGPYSYQQANLAVASPRPRFDTGIVRERID